MAINYWWKPPGWKETVESEKKFKYQLLSAIKRESEGRREARGGDEF